MSHLCNPLHKVNLFQIHSRVLLSGLKALEKVACLCCLPRQKYICVVDIFKKYIYFFLTFVYRDFMHNYIYYSCSWMSIKCLNSYEELFGVMEYWYKHVLVRRSVVTWPRENWQPERKSPFRVTWIWSRVNIAFPLLPCTKSIQTVFRQVKKYK